MALKAERIFIAGWGWIHTVTREVTGNILEATTGGCREGADRGRQRGLNAEQSGTDVAPPTLKLLVDRAIEVSVPPRVCTGPLGSDHRDFAADMKGDRRRASAEQPWQRIGSHAGS